MYKLLKCIQIYTLERGNATVCSSFNKVMQLPKIQWKAFYVLLYVLSVTLRWHNWRNWKDFLQLGRPVSELSYQLCFPGMGRDWVGRKQSSCASREELEAVIRNRRGEGVKQQGYAEGKRHQGTEQVAGVVRYWSKVTEMGEKKLKAPSLLMCFYFQEYVPMYWVVSLDTVTLSRGFSLIFSYSSEPPQHCTVHKATDHQTKDSGSLEWAQQGKSSIFRFYVFTFSSLLSYVYNTCTSVHHLQEVPKEARGGTGSHGTGSTAS